MKSKTKGEISEREGTVQWKSQIHKEPLDEKSSNRVALYHTCIFSLKYSRARRTKERPPDVFVVCMAIKSTASAYMQSTVPFSF